MPANEIVTVRFRGEELAVIKRALYETGWTAAEEPFASSAADKVMNALLPMLGRQGDIEEEPDGEAEAAAPTDQETGQESD